MKIICIEKNYVLHAQERDKKFPEHPLFFLKPDCAVLRNSLPFFIPEFSNQIYDEVGIVVKIDKLGKYIEAQYAHRYYHEIGIGIDFTAHDLQQQCITNGWPWEMSKSFDQSICIGEFVSKQELGDLHNLNFSLRINGNMAQEGNTKDMIFFIDDLIAYISQFLTLKIGDLIYTGTPQGIGSVKINDALEAYIGEKKLLECRIK